MARPGTESELEAGGVNERDRLCRGWLHSGYTGTNENGLAVAAARPLSDMARPAGFEPTIPWFVARYSIQLSYGREGRII